MREILKEYMATFTTTAALSIALSLGSCTPCYDPSCAQDNDTTCFLSDVHPFDTMYYLSCVQHNDTTIPLNAPTNGRIDDLREFMTTRPLNADAVPESIIDLVNESHALSSAPLPEEVSLTFVPEWCGRIPIPNLKAYAHPECDGHGERGIYFVQRFNEVYVPITLFHEIGHMQPCGLGHEAMAILNHLEQVTMSVGLLYNEEFYDNSLTNEERLAFLLYLDSYSEVWRTALRKPPKYALGLLASVHYLLLHNGDFEQARNEFVKERSEDKVVCYTWDEIAQDLSQYYPDIMESTESSFSELSQQPASETFVRLIWRAHKVMGNSVQERFGEDAAVFWEKLSDICPNKYFCNLF